MNLSMNEKAGFYKLFKRMNHTQSAKHMSQLLGKPFLGTIVHNTHGEGADKKTFANLKDDNGFTIRPPFREGEDEEGNICSIPVEVDPAISPLKCFIWQAATPEHQKMFWDSIFIDGRWDDVVDEKTGAVTRSGKSKNYWQGLIRTAKNYKGSPMADLLGDDGDPLGDIDLSAGGDPEQPERSDENKQASADQKAGASADPLANIG
jgi:hypothetical protein